MSHTSSSLESEIQFKAHYPPQVTADKKPVPSVNPTCLYQIQQTLATPGH